MTTNEELAMHDPLDIQPDPIIPAYTTGAAEIGVAPHTLRRAWQRGEIELIRVSPGKIGLRRSELNRYLSERVIRHEKA